ncbi:MAG: hypothetical protein OHK0039_03720 [Bacteroidia bacterium]
MRFWYILYALLRETFLKFDRDKAFKHGAAISYYTVFSLPASLIIIIDLAGALLGEGAVRSEILMQIEQMMGPDSAAQVAQMIRGFTQNEHSMLTRFVGIATLIFGATGVFYTLQDSINSLWHIPDKLKSRGGWLKQILDRVLSLAMVFILGFILAVSMILQTLIVAVNAFIRNLSTSVTEMLETSWPGSAALIHQIDWIFWTAYLLDLVVSLGVITTVFSLLFRFLPAARIAWRDAWLGAFFTAVLFSLGRILISWYIGNSHITSTYGAAGSIVLILAWVFYSSLIVLLGAEFIYVYTRRRGREIQPSRLVVSLTDQPLRRLRVWWHRRRRRPAPASQPLVPTREEELVEP